MGLTPGPPSRPPQVLGQAVAEQHVPDVVLAAQHADPEQLGKLVRLVLGCAVSCERREGGCKAGGPHPPEMPPDPAKPPSSPPFRAHPAHHDPGGVGAARGDDSHPGGGGALGVPRGLPGCLGVLGAPRRSGGAQEGLGVPVGWGQGGFGASWGPESECGQRVLREGLGGGDLGEALWVMGGA